MKSPGPSGLMSLNSFLVAPDGHKAVGHHFTGTPTLFLEGRVLLGGDKKRFPKPVLIEL